ncbi:hypothetical protein B0H14DRAFT_3500644 [Mycena olivaceomarginata]|nr:hypothetical protein B0H14DRAFT_3500644 [Mycena olivaceomarginata]
MPPLAKNLSVLEPWWDTAEGGWGTGDWDTADREWDGFAPAASSASVPLPASPQFDLMLEVSATLAVALSAMLASVVTLAL